MSFRWAVNLYFFINGVIFASWAARLPRLQEDFALDNRLLGFILLSHSIGAFIAMPITGWLINVKGSRFVTRVSGYLFPFFFIAIPFVPERLLVFVPFFLMGVAVGLMDVAMNAQAVEVEKQVGKPIMTMFHALFSIGMVVGGMAGSLFISMDVSLAHHFVIIGICGFMILMVAAGYLYPDVIQANEEEEVVFALPNGPLVGLGIIAFCCMMGEGAMSDWSTNYMKHIVGSTKDFHAFGLIGFAAMMTFGRLLGDKGRALYGDRSMMLAGAVFSLLGIALILSLFHPILVIIGFGMVGLGLANIVPIVFSLAGSFPDIKPGMGIAMATTIGYAGFMFGPPMIGFLADMYDLRVALGLIALLFIIMTCLVYRYKPS